MEAEKELLEWEKLKRKEKIEKLQEKWIKRRQENKEKDKENTEVWTKKEKVSPEVNNKRNKPWRKESEDMGNLKEISQKEAEYATALIVRERVAGGGSPKGAFPFKSKVPTVPIKTPPGHIQEGDPPIGKERGTLGVGTGPTPPSNATRPPKTGENFNFEASLKQRQSYKEKIFQENSEHTD